MSYRWVRDNDPDGAEKSFHPIRPYKLTKSNNPHPLINQLKELEVSKDEIYMGMEKVVPSTVLMQTNTLEGTIPLLSTHVNKWGGTIHNFLPGHFPEISGHPIIIYNIKTLIDDLLKK